MFSIEYIFIQRFIYLVFAIKDIVLSVTHRESRNPCSAALALGRFLIVPGISDRCEQEAGKRPRAASLTNKHPTRGLERMAGSSKRIHDMLDSLP